MNVETSKEHILIVDDDPGICKMMQLIFKAKGYDASSVHTGKDTLSAMKSTQFDLAILDIKLPDMEGIDLLSILNEDYPDLDIFMVTGHASVETAIRALNLGASAYFTKPIDMEDVLRTISSSLERRRMIEEKKSAEENLRQELEINRAVAYLSGVMNDPQINIEKMSATLLEYSMILTKSKHGYVSTIDSDTKENILQTQTSIFEQKHIKVHQQGKYPGLLGHALNTHMAFFTNSPSTHEASKGVLKKSAKLNRFLSVPAIVADEIVGQISLANSERDYDKQDLDAILRLSRLFATAIKMFRNREQLRYLAELLDDVSEAIISTDLEFKVRSWKKAAEDIYGWSFEEVEGKPISEILKTKYEKESAADSRKTLDDSGNWSGEVLEHRKDGTMIPIFLSLSLVKDIDLKTVGFVSVSRDMTQQKYAQSQMEYERDRAMLYLDLMGHDIRNKLQAIIMGVDIVSEIPVEESIRLILTDVINAAEKIRILISKVKKTEQLTLVPLSEVQVGQVLDNTVKEFSRMNEDVEIKVSREDNGVTIMADEFLDDMLYIFLENAVEHNSHQRKRVWVSSEIANGGVQMSIGDNGVGILDERKVTLFDKTRRFGGVSLHQAKQIIDKYRGTIAMTNRVTNNVQSGTVFKIWIPLGNGLNGMVSHNLPVVGK
ncbi:MAG: response regulator [Candidatus Thorarchaeota archaeon]|nr:MAG: response regulator [Candidatus Thorarchaeota archaeon]